MLFDEYGNELLLSTKRTNITRLAAYHIRASFENWKLRSIPVKNEFCTFVRAELISKGINY